MPLSQIQSNVLRIIAANRSEESYLAGATVLHRHADSIRFSQDVDLFHAVQEQIALSAEKDVQLLTEAGYGLEWILRTPGFHRAVVISGNSRLRMEWAQDRAFRFFPLQQDELCGWRLHDADAATNKLLALAGRSEVRDFVDVLDLHASYLSLGALAWAACGKDPGFTPDFLLDHAARHVAYTQTDLDRLDLRQPLDLTELKQRWFAAMEEARKLFSVLPPEDAGCLYLDANQTPVVPDPESSEFASLTRHFGSPRGAWPRISSAESNGGAGVKPG